ncbi:MAG: hypothetical protein ABIJ12_02915 [bacterium]
MIKKKLILVMLLFIANNIGINSIMADIKPTEADFGMAIVIERRSDEADAGGILGKSSLIMKAIDNYCYHYLLNNQARFQILISENSTDKDSLISSLFHRYFTKILFIKPNIGYFSSNKIVTDRHGRKYFRTINNNLDLKINYQEYILERGEWLEGKAGRLNEKGQREWYDHKVRYQRGNENIIGRAEPYEFVIQRGVEKLFEDISLPENQTAMHNKSIPIKIFSGRAMSAGKDTVEYKEIIDFASSLFYNQFGYDLKLTCIENLDSSVDENVLYSYQLNSGNYFFGDTIRAFIFEKFDFPEYYNSKTISEIGYSRLGNEAIRIKLFPSRVQAGFDWNSYFNALTLLHEIGHIFGAIHASDINSIMNYSYSWIGPRDYDPVNAKIMKAVMQGKVHPDDAAKYLSFVSTTLQETDYGLIDFPSFFYEFLNLGKNKKYCDKLRAAIGYMPYLLAVDGYTMLKEGNLEQAAALFRQAIRFEPNQASLHYYLSLVTQGKESIQARQNAARMGYLDALD